MWMWRVPSQEGVVRCDGCGAAPQGHAGHSATAAWPGRCWTVHRTWERGTEGERERTRPGRRRGKQAGRCAQAASRRARGATRYSLLGGDLGVPSGSRAHHGLPGIRGAGAGGREAVARWALRACVASRALAVMVSHALRGQIALVHALCAVLAGRAAIFVDALGLALAAAHTSAACPEGG